MGGRAKRPFAKAVLPGWAKAMEKAREKERQGRG